MLSLNSNDVVSWPLTLKRIAGICFSTWYSKFATKLEDLIVLPQSNQSPVNKTWHWRRQLYNPSAYSLANKRFNNNKASSKWGSFGKLNAQIANKQQHLHANLWMNLNAKMPKFNVISMAHKQYFINSLFFRCSTFRHEGRQYICWLVAHK